MKHSAVGNKDIVTTLRNDGAFNILVKCLRAADRVNMLEDEEGEFTLFAPCEHAFKKLSDEGLLKSLLDNHELLVKVVNYHIIPRRLFSTHTDGRKVLRTLEGRSVLVDVTAGFRVNEAVVTRPDIECSNGVIHEIDTVLLLHD